MALNIADGQHVIVWEVEDKGNYSLVKMGTSRKDKRDGSYKNSNWSFVRFVGKAHEKAKKLSEKDRILLKGATISLEPYMDGDEKKWPKNPQITVFNFEMNDGEVSASRHSESEEEVEYDKIDENDLPF